MRSAGHTAHTYSITMELSGTPGAAFTGEFWRDGKRVSISGVLPWSLTVLNVSRWEIRKARKEETLQLHAQGGGSMVSAASGPDTQGLRVKTEGGWSFEAIR
jgi:hypothetical protein